MIVTYLRSSSFNCWSFCQHQYLLSYVFGWRADDENGWQRPRPGFKADQGNCVHKALELRARQKLAIQNGESVFREDEIGKEWPADSFTLDDAFDEAWDYYSTRRAPHWDWDRSIWKKVRKWTHDAVTMTNGRWDPMNREVVQPEQYFDLVIDKPWARYNYPGPDGKKIEGQLAVKGTVDLILKEDSDTLSYVDWKTGMRKDWASGLPKDWKKLRDDPQLRMYHWALSQLYPQYEHILMTIVWVQDGGPFTLDFGPDDLPKTEEMLRKRFEEIKASERPSRIIHNERENFKCKYMCDFFHNRLPGSNQSVCDQVHKEIVQLGLSRVTEKYADYSKLGAYGEGGGRAAKDESVCVTTP